jgi:hypoxanthine-guanine phosphoribosyltransferase
MSSSSIPGLDRILFTEEQIDARIREVAAEITARYQGRTVKLIGVLKGSVFFMTALARYIELSVKIDFLAISSFSNKSGSPGVVALRLHIPRPQLAPHRPGPCGFSLLRNPRPLRRRLRPRFQPALP